MSDVEKEPDHLLEYKEMKIRLGSIAMEALQDLFHKLPFNQEIILSNGMKGRIRPFIEPKRGTIDGLDDVPFAVIEIAFEEGDLEFVIYQSGCGGSF